MKVTLSPKKLAGTVAAPPSKSIAHRYLIAAACADGESRIRGISTSEDISATIDCLCALGAEITLSGDVAVVRGIDPRTAAPKAPLPCRESGSTLRFFLPICLLSGKEVTLTGSRRLMERPLSVYESLANERGFALTRRDGGVSVCGPLSGGEYTVRGDVSSQFITGLLFALPFAGGGVIRLLPPVESRSYLDLTVAALARFGLAITSPDEYTLVVPAADRLTPCDLTVEGDYSNSAFLEALTLLGHGVHVTGLTEDSRQGDRVYRDYFQALLTGTPTLSLADCPDLGPILMAVAAALHGARFTDTARLAIKESDRGVAMAEELKKFGINVTLAKNEITVPASYPKTPKEPLCGHNDHRIVMALATLSTLVGGEIEGAEAVKKSLPEYFSLLTSLGAQVIYHEAD